MSEDTSGLILIVEDDLDLAEMLNAYFRVQGHKVMTAAWGADGLRMAQESLPDLIILDIRLPDIDGYEVCRQLREHRRTKEIPIIFLTEKRQRRDRLAGLQLGAVDYITKPFDIQELRLRARNSLRRRGRSAQINPVTDLPERTLVDENLEALLQRKDWSALVISLLGIDRFREQYGFVAADDVLRAVSLMIVSAVQELTSSHRFVGHLEHTDFLVIADSDVVDEARERVLRRVSPSIRFFYPIRHRDLATGGDSEFDLIHISSGIVRGPEKQFQDVATLKADLLRSRRVDSSAVHDSFSSTSLGENA